MPHTTTTRQPSSNLPGKPPVVDQATWQAARDELLVREKAHTREGDAIAAARRRLPMVEIDGTVEVTGPDGPVPFIDLFQGRDVLLAHKHMWHDGIPIEGQCMGCTINTWHIQRAAVYLNARGVSFAVLTDGPVGRGRPVRRVHGVHRALVLGARAGRAGGRRHGAITCFLRDGDRVFLTYRTTGRGNEPAAGVFGLLDMTPYGRGEAWEETPDGWPEGHDSCWFWRTDADGVATWGPTSRPVPQWTRPGRPRSSDGPGNHH